MKTNKMKKFNPHSNLEYKFRFWNTIARRFLKSEKQGISINGDLIFYDYESREWESCKFSDSCIVPQQWTGLYDKSKVEIYEGDLIKYCGSNDIIYPLAGEVSIGEYFTHSGEFKHYGVRVKRIDMDSYFGLGNPEEFVVIGNIFEHKLLVKK